MPSLIDPSKPTDGVPAAKADLRGNLQSAKNEIEALQSGKADLGHTHTIADISDAGALAGKSMVAAGDVADGAITAAKLGAQAVTTTKLADDAVTLAKLAPGQAGRLLGYDAQGHPAEIAQGAAGGLDADTLDGQQATAFAPASHGHTLAQISGAGALAGKSTVATADIDAEAVDIAQIANGAVTGAKLAASAVGTSKLAAAAVTTSKIAANAVDGNLLTDAAVSTAKLADGSVTTAKLAEGAVTQAKLANGAVGADQLQDGIPISMQDQQLTRPQLKHFSETSTTPAVGSGTLTLDLETGNVFEVTLTGNVTSLILPIRPWRAGPAPPC